MARMHSRKKGKSSSTQPAEDRKSTWQRYDKKEATLLVIKLAKEQKAPSEIGLILRDVYGIPNIKKLTDKTLTEILKENKLSQKIPEDLLNLIKRSIQIAKTMKPVELDDHPFKWEAITTWPKEERPAKLDVPEGTIAIRTNPKRKKSLLGIVEQYKRADGADPITTIVLQVEDKTIVEEISSGKRKATED